MENNPSQKELLEKIVGNYREREAKVKLSSIVFYLRQIDSGVNIGEDPTTLLMRDIGLITKNCSSYKLTDYGNSILNDLKK